MADKFIIYLGHKGEAVQWAVVNPGTHAVLEEGSGTLSEVAKQVYGHRVVVLIPSDEVLLSEVKVPVRSPGKVRMAAPNVLEEVLSDDIEDLHYAIGRHQDGDVYPVAVMARQRIEYYQHLLAEQGIRIEKLMPSVLALPFSDKHWSIMQEGDEVVVRESEYVGFSCAPENLQLFLKQALRDVGDADMPIVHTFQNFVDIPEDLGLEVEQQETASLMHVFAEGIEQGLVINLLQGEYKPLRKENPIWSKWRRTVYLAAAMGVLWLGSSFQQVYDLKQKNAALIEEIYATYAQTFPGSRIANPRAQMKQKLAELKGGSQSGAGAMLSHLSGAATQIQKAEGTQLNGFYFRKGDLDLEVRVKDLKSLETLRGAFASAGLNSEVLTAKSEAGVVNGRIRVQ